MDIENWAATGVAAVAAAFAGWQAWEARKARTGAESAAERAANSAERSADASERSAGAHEKIAEAVMGPDVAFTARKTSVRRMSGHVQVEVQNAGRSDATGIVIDGFLPIPSLEPGGTMNGVTTEVRAIQVNCDQGTFRCLMD